MTARPDKRPPDDETPGERDHDQPEQPPRRQQPGPPRDRQIRDPGRNR